MKTAGFVIRFIFVMLGVLITCALATFFLAIFKLSDVQQAVEFFTNLLKIS